MRHISPGLSLLALALVSLISGCGGSSVLAPVESRDNFGPAPPGYHRVLRGETLSSISRQTGQTVAQLAAWNALEPPYLIKAGGLVRIVPPSSSTAAQRPGARATTTAKTTTSSPTQSAALDKVAKVDGVAWRWPLQGPIKQTYEAGNRSRQGIRIGATPGAQVRAVAKGNVVYSGSGLKGYGNLIIVKHNDRFLSVYGFNRRLIVRQGDKVRAGQVLAEAGQDPAGASLLHFEIRRDGSTVDPLDYLPTP